MGRVRARLSYANVMVTVLLFIVLGDVGYAAMSLAKNSVRSKHIVNGQVKGADVDETTLSGLVRGSGNVYSGRTTFILGGGGKQPLVTVPRWGSVVGGCGSGGGAIGFENSSGESLRIYPFASGVDVTPVTVADGASSSLFPPGIGEAGFTHMQIVPVEAAKKRLLTVIATRDAYVSGTGCAVQAVAIAGRTE